jgi:protoporphyrinogen IX oxidase
MISALYIKSLHIIFVVTWFAGLFYIVRLFIYHTEAKDKTEVEKNILQAQFKIMESRLWYGITWPSMILTYIFGFWMLYEYNYWLMPWMWLKLSFIAGLTLYHLYCQRIFNNIQKNNFLHGSTALRFINEGATLFLIAIVFIVVLKDTFSWIYGLLGLILFSIVLMLGIKLYKKSREKSN